MKATPSTKVPEVKADGPARSSPTEIELALAEHPFLKGMSFHQRRILADCAMREQFVPGEFLIRQGDPANRFYLITKGKVVLDTCLAGRGRVPIQTIGAGDVLGWSWLFPPYYWNFDARAMEPTEAIFIYGTPLREECDEDHEFGYEMFKRMSEVVIKRLQCTRVRLLDKLSTTKLPADDAGNL